jgi:DNA repair exonuclease SbcCD ATPase subunit
MNYINFDEFIKKVVNINGNNGSGKSSLLEIIAVAIYGESFPSRSAKSFTASIINQHIPKTETAYSKICFSIDGTKYWIHRTYDTQPNGNEKSLWQRIIRLLDNEGEIVKEKANAVDPWIEEHVGVYKHFLLTTIMSQFNDNDFFSLSPKDQKVIIDSLLHLNVCESFRLLLKEAQKNHEYALSQLTTYEAGLISSNSRFETHYGKESDIQAQLEQEETQRLSLASLKVQLDLARSHIVEFSEKAFQQPLSDYEKQKAQLMKLLETPLESNISDLKVSKTNLRNQLAVLKSK